MAEKEMQKGLSSLAQAWPAARGDVRDGYIAARDLDGEGGFFVHRVFGAFSPGET